MSAINNTPRFLLCENPMSDEKNNIHREFIMHTKNPRFLAMVYELDDDLRNSLKNNNDTGFYAITNEFDGVEYLIKVIQLYSDDKLTQEFAEKMAKIISRCGDWYFAFLKFEKENYD